MIKQLKKHGFNTINNISWTFDCQLNLPACLPQGFGSFSAADGAPPIPTRHAHMHQQDHQYHAPV